VNKRDEQEAVAEAVDVAKREISSKSHQAFI